MRQGYRGYKDLNVYKLAYQMALEIHKISQSFPSEEKVFPDRSIRRVSRSIAANLAEAWKKRRYEKAFVSKLIDCAGEAGEVEAWLDFYIYLFFEDNFLYTCLRKRDKFS